MSDPAKVRLVRCPKCENLLPELVGYSVYQCGGCGAVLQAENRNLEMDSSSQKSDDARMQDENLYRKLDNISCPETKKSFTEASDNDVRSGCSTFRRDEKGDKNLKADEWIADNYIKRNENLSGSFRADAARGFEGSGVPNGNTTGSHRSESFTDSRRGTDGNEHEDFWRNRKQGFKCLGYSTPVYQENGPSNHHLRPSYGYGELSNNGNGANELNKVEYLEHDRAELLRKLDELKDQISRSCDINHRPKENISHGPGLSQPQVPYANKPLYPNQYNEQPPCMHNYHPSMNAPNQMQGFRNHLIPPLLQRHSLQEPLSHFQGYSTHTKTDPYEQMCPKDMNTDHTHCSCFHCCNNLSRAIPLVPPVAFPKKMSPHELYNPILYRHQNPSSFGPWDYNPKAINHPPLSTHNNHPSRVRWNTDLNSDGRGYVSNRPSRVAIVTGKRQCHPIAGGAPLILCYNCFLLLELPKKFALTKKSYREVKCGACSTVILFAVANKKLVSIGLDARTTPNMGNMNPSFAVGGSNLHPQHANRASMNFSSEDYDSSSYNFQFPDGEINTDKSENKRDFRSTSFSSSENEFSPDTMKPLVAGPDSTEIEAKTDLCAPQFGSPLQDHFDYSSKYLFEKGNRSRHSDREKEEFREVTSRQNSMKDGSFATDMDVSFNEDMNDTGISQESGDTGKDEENLRANKGTRSFFAGVMKKGFKDLSKLNNNTIERSSMNVTINGHPVTDRVLKKAEKIAGPVHPGQYWYDFRAGFWGVIGGPCLGIIPPFIEEFNYPMPENCAGGDTTVFVNGRELHQKDLNLLSSRGLPPVGGRSYIIEISGAVLDQDTGEELQGLGKLAPTVEKAKHGFGMKVPRVTA